ncbi:MAG: PpiC-type peptidyl-prolyl cis-trans isomerase [Candidatus Solibacter sp.]|nr:PpiC-type peptidyl-prolyl cis-trans isomerase [Candidatus Solibacter sp.]
MFDLFRSRDKMVRILLGALLGVVALSMLTYLVPNYSNGSSGSDLIVAEIGKETITLPDMQRVIQLTIRGRQLPTEILPTYIPQMVDQMVTERAMAMEADRLGYQVSDADVADMIRQTIPSLFPDGKFVGKETYAAMLAQQNMTIDQFEADLKRQVAITRFRDIAMEGTIVTPAEIEAAYRKKNEKIKVEWVKLTADKYKAESQPTPQEMRDFYNANSSRYMVPEKKNLSVLVADAAKMEAGLTVTDADLQRAYDQNKEAFRTPERVKARHILLKTQGKSASEEAAIKAKGEALLKQIRGGADFAKLAKENSEDPGSAVNGGNLSDWITHGQMVPEFDKAIFQLKPGQISDLVKTQYGYHIVQTLERQDAGMRSFAEVKNELATQYRKQRANELMQQASDRAQAALQKDPQHPEKVAADLNMQLIKVPNFVTGGAIGELLPNGDFDQAVGGLKKGEVSQPVTVNNKVVLASVDDVVPGHPSSFEEVQTQVRDAIVTNRSAAAVQKHATELVDKAKAMGGDLQKAAKSMGLDVKTSGDVDRSGSIEGLGTASYVSEGFSRPDGTVFGPMGLPDGGTAVMKVISHSGADMAGVAAQRSTIRDEIKSQRARDRNTLFENGVKDMLIKQGKIKIHQDVINRLIANYKTS